MLRNAKRFTNEELLLVRQAAAILGAEPINLVPIIGKDSPNRTTAFDELEEGHEEWYPPDEDSNGHKDESCDVAEGYGGNSGPIGRQRRREGTKSFKSMPHSEQTETLEPSASNSLSALFQADDSPHRAVCGPSSLLSDFPYVPSPCYYCNDQQKVQGSNPVYDTWDDFLLHFLRDHEGPSRWITARCPWAGCHTKCTFDTLKIWLDHVRVVHREAFYCEHEGCKISLGGPNAKPFGSRADLNRHSQVHTAAVLCDKPGCTRKQNLSRRDKRSKHLFTYHGHIQCYYIDCPRRHVGDIHHGFSTHRDLVEHLEEKHELSDDASPNDGTASLFPIHEGSYNQQASMPTLQLPESPRSLISDETWVDSGYGSQSGDKEESPPPKYPPPLDRSTPRKAEAYPEGVEAWCHSQSTVASGKLPEPSSLSFACQQASTTGQPPEMIEGRSRTYFRPRQCPLEICRTWPTKDHIFMTSDNWQAHLKCVHPTTILCTVHGCTAAPFGNKTDLNRHVLNKHRKMWDAAKPYKCMRSDCVATIKAFARKDKFEAHKKNYHARPLSKCATCHRYFNNTVEFTEHRLLCIKKIVAANLQERVRTESQSTLSKNSNLMTGIDHGLSKVGDAASQPEFEDHQSSLDDAELVAEDAAYATDEWSEESVEAEMSGTEDDLYEALYSDDGRLEHLPITNSAREALIERIMDEFMAVFNREWASNTTQCAGGSSPSSASDVQRQAYKNKLSSSQPFNSKRKQEDGEDDEGQDRSDEREGPSKKKARSKESGMNIKFACPFRKHNPTKYDVVRHRLCALTPLETVARVKGHLYRKHLAPLHCGRCWQVFEDTNELTAHANRPRADICEATDGTAPEGVTTEQERKLRRKTRSYPNQSDESRWRDIYKVLFPGYPVPLPYFEAPREERAITPNSRSLDDYDNHMRERLPQLFRSRVEQHFNATVIQGFDFGNLLRECQEQVSRTFRETTIGHVTNESTSLNTNEARDQSPVIEGAASGPASSSDFVFEVLQPPPPQLDSQMLDSSLEANIRGAGPAPGANRSSDSGYSSGGPCNCIGLCTCQGTAMASDDPTNIENLSTSSLQQDFNIGASSSTIIKPPPETHPNRLDQDSKSREVLDPQQPTYYDRQTHNACHIPENTGNPFNIDSTTLTNPFPDLDFWSSNDPPFHLDEFFGLGYVQTEIIPENGFVSDFYFGDGPP